MLAEALTGSLLAAARSELDGEQEANLTTAPERPPRIDTRDPGTGFYVYCVSSAAESAVPDGLPGVDPAHLVTSLQGGELAAVVSAVPLSDFDEERLREHLGDMAWVEQVARRHEEVLETVNARRTVIPMRMCTIYRDQAGVQAMLTREAEAMSTALSELEGRSEWGVKVFVGPRDPERPRADRERDPQITGAAYMQQRQREQRERGEIEGRRRDAAEAIFARLDSMAVRAAIIPPQRPEVSGHPGAMLLNSVYLVSDDDLPAFDGAVGALQDDNADLGLELQITGPWPAYNFVPDAIGAAP
jgi:hypothetical protein